MSDHSVVDLGVCVCHVSCSAVVSQKLEKDKRMSEEAYRHWSEIAERRMDFYRYARPSVASIRELV